MTKMGIFQFNPFKSSNESKKPKGEGRSGGVMESEKPNIYSSSRWYSGSNPSAHKKENGRSYIYNRNYSLKNQQQEKQVNPSQNQNITSINSQQSKQVIVSQSNNNPSSYSQQSNFCEPYQNANNQNFQGYNNNNNHISNIDYYIDQNYNNKSNNEYTSGGYSSNNYYYQSSNDKFDYSEE